VPLAPPLLDRVVRRCLAKDPDRRWQSARDVAASLEWTADAEALSSASAEVIHHRVTRRELLSWITIALTLLVAAVGGGGAPAETRTLSNVAVFTTVGSWLVTARPMFVADGSVSATDPTSVHVLPFDEIEPVI
jgi:serine/threonine-protein kinase